MWDTIRPHLISLDPQRIESGGTAPGFPDVEFVGGTMELKEISLPKRAAVIVLVPKFVQEQRVWAVQRKRRGGRVFFLLKVGHLWMLFDGGVAAAVVGRCSLEELHLNAIKVWDRHVDGKELLSCLRP